MGNVIPDTIMIKPIPFATFVLQTVSNAKTMLFVKPVTQHSIKGKMSFLVKNLSLVNHNVGMG